MKIKSAVSLIPKGKKGRANIWAGLKVLSVTQLMGYRDIDIIFGTDVAL